MKDHQGKELSREFAPSRRPAKEDLYKVRVVEKQPDYDVVEEDGRIKVTKREYE